MFASVFVAGAPAVFVFIYIESRSDLFKLEKTMRRPLPFKTHHIGSWIVTLEIFGFLAIFSNIIVSCYCSNQMDYLLPWLKDYKDNSATAMTTVFCLEHVILLTVFSLRLALDQDPEWINQYLARRAKKEEIATIKRLPTKRDDIGEMTTDKED